MYGGLRRLLLNGLRRRAGQTQTLPDNQAVGCGNIVGTHHGAHIDAVILRQAIKRFAGTYSMVARPWQADGLTDGQFVRRRKPIGADDIAHPDMMAPRNGVDRIPDLDTHGTDAGRGLVRVLQ